MSPTRLRSWIRRYGNAGILLVGGYLAWRHLWTNRRASLIGSLVVAGVLALWLCAPRSAPEQQRSPVKRSPAATAHSHLPSPPLRNIRVLLSKRPGAEEADYERWIGAVAGTQILWKDVCEGKASALADEQVVYYACRNTIVARRFDGRILWRDGGLSGATGIADVCSGTGVLFVEDDGPIWGVEIAHPECWEGSDGVIGSCRVKALKSRHAEPIWEASEAEVGHPLWTDGTEFLDARLDVSAGAIRRVVRFGACLPMWMELRRVSDHHRLWRQRLRGYPPGLTSVKRIVRGRVKFVFANKDHHGMNEFDFVPYADETAVVVPLDHGPIESGGLQPRVSALITAGLNP